MQSLEALTKGEVQWHLFYVGAVADASLSKEVLTTRSVKMSFCGPSTGRDLELAKSLQWHISSKYFGYFSHVQHGITEHKEGEGQE